MQRYNTSSNTPNKFRRALIFNARDTHEATRGGAKRPREERKMCGGLRSGARGAGASDLAPRMRGGWRGEERAHRANPRPPSGTKLKRKRGNTPPPDSDRRERRGGGRGEGAGRQGLRAGRRPRQTDCGRSAPAKQPLPAKHPRPHEARGLDGRATRTTSEGERGEPKRERPSSVPLFRCAWSGREETRSGRTIREAERSEAVASRP